MTYQSGGYLQSDYPQKACPPDIDKNYADYDAAGRLPGFTNFNGTQTAYSYDNANRLTAINNQKSDSAILSNYTFALDANGNRTHIAQDEPYAPSIGEGDATYTYNTQKNRLLSTSAEGSFGYDDEGQLQTGYSTDYTFDYEHRLKTIGGTQFYYDGGGKRLKALRDGVTTRYIYDAGGALLAEADANNNITQYYIYGNGLLAMVTPGDQTYCYHYNGVGSTTAMTNASQEIINKYSYDAFGNIASEQEAITQPFKYVGQFGVMYEPNGFYYMRARYYDPKVGRFISEDPIGFDGGDVNLLAYVGNNPVTGIDPSGLRMTALGDDYLGSMITAENSYYYFLQLGANNLTLQNPWATPNPYLENSMFGSNGSSTKSTTLTSIGITVLDTLSSAKAQAIYQGVGSIAAVGGGILIWPIQPVAGSLMVGTGITNGFYAATILLVEYGFHGDTSSIPNPWIWMFTIGKGMWNWDKLPVNQP